MQCPKCSYARVASDTSPAYECPKCGIVYAKHDSTRAHAVASKTVVPLTASPICKTMDGTIPGNLAVCKSCEEVGQIAIKTPGSRGVEIALYVLYVVPGIVYSVWRQNSRKQVCSACGSDQLIAAKTRLGTQIVHHAFPGREIGAAVASEQTRPPHVGKLLGRLIWFFAAWSFLLAGVGIFIEGGGPMIVGCLLLGIASAAAARNISAARPVKIAPVGQGLIGW